jgi:hypothetical protein
MAMNEIKTKIVLRNDESEAWADSSLILDKGEVGLEYGSDGVVKLKAGDGEHSFADLDYIGSDVKSAQLFQTAILAYNDMTDDLTAIKAVIPEGAELQDGDVAVVKRAIANNSAATSYTTYIYNSSMASTAAEGWIASDGNYSATNVFFKNDITLAGDYTSIGNVKLTDGTLSAAGQSLEDVITSIFTKELKTNLKTSNPTIDIAVSSIKYLEIGSSGSNSATLSFNDGAYKYGYTVENVTTDGTVPSSYVESTSVTGAALLTNENAYSVTFNGTTTTYPSTQSSVSLTSPVKKTKASLSVSATAKYGNGYAPISNLKKAYPGQKITAGTTAADSAEAFRWYVPYYKGFIYGADNKLNAVDVSKLTKVIDSTAYTASKPKSDTATGDWIQYWLVAPKDYNWSMTDAKDGNGLTLDVDTTQPNIKITYGTGNNAVEVEYKVLVISHKAPYTTKGISWS